MDRDMRKCYNVMFLAKLTNYLLSLVHPVGRHHTQLPRNNPNALFHVSQSHTKFQSNASNYFSTNPISHSFQLPTKHRCMTPHEPHLYITLQPNSILLRKSSTHINISSLSLSLSLYTKLTSIFSFSSFYHDGSNYPYQRPKRFLLPPIRQDH